MISPAQFLKFLTARQIECLSLYYGDGHSIQEIATLLKIAKETAKNHLESGLNNIKSAGLPAPKVRPRITPIKRSYRTIPINPDNIESQLLGMQSKGKSNRNRSVLR